MSPSRVVGARAPRCSKLLGRAVFFWGALVAGCNRTPPEPAPPVQAETSPRAEAKARPTAAPSRCIVELPATAPEIPPPAAPPACPRDPEPDRRLPLAEVSFPEAPSAPRIDVELAKAPPDVERGLMFRRAMADDRGMLFKLDGRREHTFWMHNTCIPLDMLFIDDDGVIVGIVEGAAPLTDTTRSVGCPSVFVLEVNGGWARKHGVAPGQKIAIPFAAR